eukprot:12324024-Karenia_brevis.AAC.1
MRAKVFTRCRKAKQLYTTNVAPKASFDVPVFGMTPSEKRRMRATAADLTTVVVKGRCTATALLLNYKVKEPYTAAVVEQVKSWLRMWHANPSIRKRLTKGWMAVRQALHEAKAK